MVEHRHGSRSLRLRWLVAVAIVWSMAAGVAGAAHRPYGDARVLAQVPTPRGSPRASPCRATWSVSGPATFGTAGGPPSKVLVYHAGTGTLVRSFDIQGEDLSQEHANSSIAVDRQMRAYVLNTQLGSSASPSKGSTSSTRHRSPTCRPSDRSQREPRAR